MSILQNIVLPLLSWYDSVAANRAMPWRLTRDPYAIWLSEIMLQQTQVETVKPFYLRFLNRFPTVTALAEAPLQDVLTHWAGLGYYRRARHLHLAAQQVVAKHGSRFPEDASSLQSLPGIGRYTAGAVASIAFNTPAPVVDGNVARLLARLTAFEENIALPASQAFFWNRATEIQAAAAESPAPRHGDLNQAMMELGSTICTPQNPACLLCPLRAHCAAHAAGRQNDLPIKVARKATPVVQGAALVMLRQRGKSEGTVEVLLLQRPAGGIWEQMWEFPVIDRAAVKIVLAEKTVLRLPVSSVVKAGKVKHQLTHRTLMYDVYVCQTPAGRRVPELPACIGTPSNYAAARWEPWPMPAHPEFPIAKVVHKIAAHASVTVKGIPLNSV